MNDVFINVWFTSLVQALFNTQTTAVQPYSNEPTHCPCYSNHIYNFLSDNLYQYSNTVKPSILVVLDFGSSTYYIILASLISAFLLVELSNILK